MHAGDSVPKWDAHDKGEYRSKLNYKEQTKEISNLKYEDLPRSEDELFFAKVTFEVIATGKLMSFSGSSGKYTKKAAHEEAARVACIDLCELVQLLPHSTAFTSIQLLHVV